MKNGFVLVLIFGGLAYAGLAAASGNKKTKRKGPRVWETGPDWFGRFVLAVPPGLSSEQVAEFDELLKQAADVTETRWNEKRTRVSFLGHDEEPQTFEEGSFPLARQGVDFPLVSYTPAEGRK